MDPKSFTGVVIGTVIGVLLISTLLIPFINEGTAAEKTVTNEGAFFTTPDGENHTIVLTGGKLTYDGEDCILPDLSLYGGATIMCGEDWFVRITGTDYSSVLVVVAGPPQQYANMGTVTTADTMTMNVTGDSVVIVIGESTQTRTGVEYMIASKGDYVLAHDPYFIEETTFTGAIRNQQQSHDIMEIVSGTFTSEDIDAELCRLYNFTTTATTTISETSFVVNSMTVNGDLKKLNDITQSLTTADGMTGNITIDYIIVPAEITYDNPTYAGSDAASILGVIPILVVVGLIVGITAVLYTRRE